MINLVYSGYLYSAIMQDFTLHPGSSIKTNTFVLLCM